MKAITIYIYRKKRVLYKSFQIQLKYTYITSARFPEEHKHGSYRYESHRPQCEQPADRQRVGWEYVVSVIWGHVAHKQEDDYQLKT